MVMMAGELLRVTNKVSSVSFASHGEMVQIIKGISCVFFLILVKVDTL